MPASPQDRSASGPLTAVGIQLANAQPPHPPALDAAGMKAREERERYTGEREAVEHRSVLRGLMLLALVALLVSLYRAGHGRVFFPGWWRQW